MDHVNAIPEPEAPSLASPWMAFVVGFVVIAVIVCLCAVKFIRSRNRSRKARAIIDRLQQDATLERDESAQPARLPSSELNSWSHRREYGTAVSSQVANSNVANCFQPSAPPLVEVVTASSRERVHLVSFKMHKEKASEVCEICLEPFGTADVASVRCLHVFHTACLKTWLAKEESQGLCPLCYNPLADMRRSAEFWKLVR